MDEDLNNEKYYDNIDLTKYKYQILPENFDNYELNFKIIIIYNI